MKELGFENFLEEFSVETVLDEFPAKLQEKMTALLRDAYMCGYDNGVKQKALQLKNNKQ